jgi:hypothetical protein
VQSPREGRREGGKEKGREGRRRENARDRHTGSSRKIVRIKKKKTTLKSKSKDPKQHSSLGSFIPETHSFPHFNMP